VFDYRIRVTAWPHWVRIRWPNTIATIVLIARFAPDDQTTRYRLPAKA
jgi:hypothetical protein